MKFILSLVILLVAVASIQARRASGADFGGRNRMKRSDSPVVAPAGSDEIKNAVKGSDVLAVIVLTNPRVPSVSFIKIGDKDFVKSEVPPNKNISSDFDQ